MSNLSDELAESIRRSIKGEIEKIVENEAKEAARRVELAVRTRAAEISSVVLNHFSFEKYGSKLRIEIDFQNTQKT